jgi:3-oxoacyl-[acyl-carrier protein] reductase
MIDTQLEGRVVLITGANHGIGAATALAFAAQGAHVYLTFWRNPTSYTAEALAKAELQGIGGPALYEARQQQDGAALAQRIIAAGGHAAAKEADLADPAAIPQLFDDCEACLGPVDILISNHTHCVLETFDPALARDEGFPVSVTNAPSIDAHFAINARATALLMAEYLRRYVARGAHDGRIIAISTDAAHAHVANISYAASKHAIESYSRSAAAEMGPYGVTVNVVAPGPIQTGYLTPSQEKEIAAQTPLRRVGEPEDVADVVVFLASAEARWVTGQLLYVGGGYRMPQ